MNQLCQSFITAAVNITGKSLVQKAQLYFKTLSLFLPHNNVEVGGIEGMTLSNSKDKDKCGGKYVSNKLSEHSPIIL